MRSDVVTPRAPLVETILRTTLACVVVAPLVRTSGKRGLAEMSTFDVVVALLLAGIVGGAAVGEDDGVTGGAVAAPTLIASSVAVRLLVHSSSVAADVLQGKLATVIRDGEVAEGALRKLRISQSELDHAIRSRHGDDTSEVGHAKPTPSGKLVLSLRHEERSATKADIADLTRRPEDLRALLAARK